MGTLFERIVTTPDEIADIKHFLPTLTVAYTNGQEPCEVLIEKWVKLEPSTRQQKEIEAAQLMILTLRAITGGVIHFERGMGKIYYNLFKITEYLGSRHHLLAAVLAIELQKLIDHGAVRGSYRKSSVIGLALLVKEQLKRDEIHH